MALASASPSADARALRAAFGRFATGVAIVTSLDEEGARAGVTINSFASVSLDPPLVLFSLARSLRSFEAFANARALAITILGEDQADLALRFARAGVDKWAIAQIVVGENGVPCPAHGVARFECTPFARHEAGDHDIFIVCVERFTANDAPPLLFHGGAFRNFNEARPAMPAVLGDGRDQGRKTTYRVAARRARGYPARRARGGCHTTPGLSPIGGVVRQSLRFPGRAGERRAYDVRHWRRKSRQPRLGYSAQL
ncbi:MAG: flavin reductase family protein [Hyphomonadaceae bacterium JAD_PAG50586_4]|nr:MAG: flavin reductase family protein [Hyphomonadaceae bacterium JAD_PAG50586_4]